MDQKLKTKIHLILEEKVDQSLISKIIRYYLIFLIIVNTIVVALESMKTINETYKILFLYFNVFSIITFTLEYILRVWSCTVCESYQHPVWGRIRYMLTPLALIDLVAFLPFYLPFFHADLRTIRLLRLIKFLQILKVARYSHTLKILGEVLKKQKEELILTLTIVIFILLTASNLMFYLEHEAQPDKFPDIPSAMWWGIITLTTIGYGDVYPITPGGRFLGGIVAILGIGLFALPAGIIASGFTEVLAQHKTSNNSSVKICPHCGKTIDKDDD